MSDRPIACSRLHRPPAKVKRDRCGRVITPCLWLGPSDGRRAATHVLVNRPHCWCECVVEARDVLEAKSDWRIVHHRLCDSSVRIETQVMVSEHWALAECLACGNDSP